MKNIKLQHSLLAEHVKIGSLYKLTESWTAFPNHKLPKNDLVLFLTHEELSNGNHKISVLHDDKICTWVLSDLVHINEELETVNVDAD